MPRKSSGLGQSQFYGRNAAGGASDALVREKVTGQLKIALEKVLNEGKGAVEAPDPAEVAVKVEQELFNYFGENITPSSNSSAVTFCPAVSGRHIASWQFNALLNWAASE